MLKNIMPMHSEYSVLLVLFPMLTEFHYENDSYLSPCPKINIILDILDIYIYIFYRGSTGWSTFDFLVIQFILIFILGFGGGLQTDFM